MHIVYNLWLKFAQSDLSVGLELSDATPKCQKRTTNDFENNLAQPSTQRPKHQSSISEPLTYSQASKAMHQASVKE